MLSNLQIKRGLEFVEPRQLGDATRISHAISEVTNVPPYSRQPYVGSSAFAHKAGLHASALKVDPDLYQHIDPGTVGNSMRTLVSDMAGRASVELWPPRWVSTSARAPSSSRRFWPRSGTWELRGYTFDAADASFELCSCGAPSASRHRHTSRSSRGGSSPTPGRGGRDLGGDRQKHAGSAARWRPARVMARSTPSTMRCGWPSTGPTPSWSISS